MIFHTFSRHRRAEAKFSASSTEQVQQQSRVENIAEIVEPSCVTCVRTVCVRRSQVTALELRGLGPFPDKNVEKPTLTFRFTKKKKRSQIKPTDTSFTAREPQYEQSQVGGRCRGGPVRQQKAWPTAGPPVVVLLDGTTQGQVPVPPAQEAQISVQGR